jgi:hypothetical protein
MHFLIGIVVTIGVAWLVGYLFGDTIKELDDRFK